MTESELKAIILKQLIMFHPNIIRTVNISLFTFKHSQFQYNFMHNYILIKTFKIRVEFTKLSSNHYIILSEPNFNSLYFFSI